MSAQSLRRQLSARLMAWFFGATGPAQTGAADLPGAGIYQILICRITHSLGNTLLVTPLICELEARYPGAEIDVLTRSAAADDIFGGFFSIRNVYRLPAHALRHPLQVLAVLRRLRRTHYDLVIDPCPTSQTGRLMLALARGRYKLGFQSTRKSGSISHGIAVPATPAHTGQRPVYLLRSALGTGLAEPYPPLGLCLTAAERAQGARALARITVGPGAASGCNQVIGIFANATGAKLLGSAWWTEFMATLDAQRGDYRVVEIVPMFGRSLLGDRYPAYFSSDIRKLASVLSGLSLFISADCGIMHLACASDTPVFGIFTQTDVGEWGPYGPADRAIDARGLAPAQVAAKVFERAPA